jgi:hypothetical protein
VRELADRLPKKGITRSTENGNDLSPYTPFLRKIGEYRDWSERDLLDIILECKISPKCKVLN